MCNFTRILYFLPNILPRIVDDFIVPACINGFLFERYLKNHLRLLIFRPYKFSVSIRIFIFRPLNELVISWFML